MGSILRPSSFIIYAMRLLMRFFYVYRGDSWMRYFRKKKHLIAMRFRLPSLVCSLLYSHFDSCDRLHRITVTQQQRSRRARKCRNKYYHVFKYNLHECGTLMQKIQNYAAAY